MGDLSSYVLTILLAGNIPTSLIIADKDGNARRRRGGDHPTLDSLHLKYPEVGPDKLKELAAATGALVK